MSLAFVRPFMLCGVLVLWLASACSLDLSAQSKVPRDSSASQRTLQMQADPGSRNCPVSMHAQQNGWGNLVKVQHGFESKQDALSQARQQIRLKVEPSADQAPAVSAKVLVRGTSGRQRALRTSEGDGVNNIAKTLDVVFSPGKDEDAGARLVLDGFTSVNSIILKSITFVDGSTWTDSPESSCRTVPDPLMLVDSRVR